MNFADTRTLEEKVTDEKNRTDAKYAARDAERKARALGFKSAAKDAILLVRLGATGLMVLAKLYEGDWHPVTYANRTQAEKRLAELGAGWYVYKGYGRPWYLVKKEEA